MKQVININFQGQVVPIEVTAFDSLKNYTESLRRYFANEEGRDEIINDIESRIAELFQERLKAGSTCITDEDVSAIIASIGRPEDFDDAGATEQEQTKTQSSSTAGAGTHQQTSGPKRLQRDENNKVIGGVCSGLANYFGLDPVVVRVIFAVLFFAAGVSILPYLILWVAVPSTAAAVIGSSRKRFFRDPDDKIIAGVCSGIGNYFGINAWIPRVLFLLPFISVVFRWGHWGFYDFPSFVRFSFSPGSLIFYIILWLVVPEALTTAEKLEMKGEKVDLNSIKNSVVEEMKGVGQRISKMSEEVKNTAEEKSRTMSADLNKAARRSRSSFGDVIATVAKVFAYIIAGFVSLILIVTLFGFGIAAIGVFPLKDYMINDGWQNAFAWGTLLFFIAVPIIGIITWIIRRIAKVKGNSKMVRWTFSSLWVIGWFSIIFLVASVSSDFRARNHDVVEKVELTNPKVNKLEISNASTYNVFRRRGFSFEPFNEFEPGDTLFVNNVRVLIAKASGDSFSVSLQKSCRGYSKDYADTTARLMDYSITQKDSLLLLPKGIPITTRSKFRNQRVILTVYVPVGKQIRVNGNVDHNNGVHFSGPFRDGDFDIEIDDNDFEQGWRSNVDYKMTDKGLATLDGVLVNSDEYRYGPKKKHSENNNSNNGNGYRYYDTGKTTTVGKLDSLTQKVKMEKKKMQDSLDKDIQEQEKSLEKSKQLKQKMDEKIDEPAAFTLRSMPLPMMHTIR